MVILVDLSKEYLFTCTEEELVVGPTEITLGWHVLAEDPTTGMRMTAYHHNKLRAKLRAVVCLEKAQAPFHKE